MKTILVAVTAGLLLFSACTKTEDKPVDEKDKYAYDSTDIKTEPVDNPNEAFMLEYKYEKGTKYSYRITSISSDNQEMVQDTNIIRQSVQQSIIYLLDLVPSEREADGTMEIDVTINSVKLDAEANGNKFSYEFGVTKDSLERAKYAEYDALGKNTFSVRVSSKGELLEIFRADKISNKYIQLKGYADSLALEQKTVVRNDIIDRALKPLMIQLFRSIPDHKIAKDSSWKFIQPASQFMTFKLVNTNLFKIANLEELNNEKIAVIDAGLNTAITGENKVVDRGVTYVIKKPTTSAGGKIYFNIEKGYIIKSKTITRVNISYTMEAPGVAGKEKAQRNETIENSNLLELL